MVEVVSEPILRVNRLHTQFSTDKGVIPAVTVTLNFSINRASLSGVNLGPGITWVEPNHVQANGIPQAFT